MDFSVRQLDSTQRRCVYSKLPCTGSYVCPADGKYEVFISAGEWDSLHLGNVQGYLDGQRICYIGPGAVSVWDGEGNPSFYAGGSFSQDYYLSNGSNFTFSNLYSDNTSQGASNRFTQWSKVEIYFTPYK